MASCKVSSVSINPPKIHRCMSRYDSIVMLTQAYLQLYDTYRSHRQCIQHDPDQWYLVIRNRDTETVPTEGLAMYFYQDFEDDEQGPDFDYQYNCWSMLREADGRWDYASSNIFLLLPLDHRSCVDSSPLEDQFQLYFLCNNSKCADTLQDEPQCLHLLNHPGYRLKRPQEFLRLYGGHVLRMLRLVRFGYKDARYKVPPLDTSHILWGCDPAIVGNHITEHTIRSLISKSLIFLQELDPPAKPLALGLNCSQITDIKTYLVAEKGDNTEGKPHRYIGIDQTVSWRCRAHAHQLLDQESLNGLKVFAHSHGGHADLQKATLKVDLSSTTEADRFLALLTASKTELDVTVQLKWKLKRAYLVYFCLTIAKTRTSVLKIEFATQDFHHMDYVLQNQPFFQYCTELRYWACCSCQLSTTTRTVHIH